MNPTSDSGVVESLRQAQRRFGADAMVTLLHIGETESVVAAGRAEAAPAIIRIRVGSMRTGQGPFRHDPPMALELEEAIAAVEDEVMPLPRWLPGSSALIARGDAMHDLRCVTGKTGDADGEIPLSAVEHLFQQLAAVSQGRPAASSGLPAGAAFAGSLLILREFMHHLGFESVVIDSRSCPSEGCQPTSLEG